MHTLSLSGVLPQRANKINRIFLNCPKNRRSAVVAPRFVTSGLIMESGKDEEVDEEKKRLYESLLQENVRAMNDVLQDGDDWWFFYLLEHPSYMAPLACIALWGFHTFKSVGFSFLRVFLFLILRRHRA